MKTIEEVKKILKDEAGVFFQRYHGILTLTDYQTVAKFIEDQAESIIESINK